MRPSKTVCQIEMMEIPPPPLPLFVVKISGCNSNPPPPSPMSKFPHAQKKNTFYYMIKIK